MDLNPWPEPSLRESDSKLTFVPSVPLWPSGLWRHMCQNNIYHLWNILFPELLTSSHPSLPVFICFRPVSSLLPTFASCFSWSSSNQHQCIRHVAHVQTNLNLTQIIILISFLFLVFISFSSSLSPLHTFSPWRASSVFPFYHVGLLHSVALCSASPPVLWRDESWGDKSEEQCWGSKLPLGFPHSIHHRQLSVSLSFAASHPLFSVLFLSLAAFVLIFKGLYKGWFLFHLIILEKCRTMVFVQIHSEVQDEAKINISSCWAQMLKSRT